MKHEHGRSTQDLPESVRKALDALRPVPHVDQDTWAAGREAFLAEARRYAEDPVPLAVAWRRMDWKEVLRSLFSFNLRETAPLALALKLFLVVALAVGGSVGTVSAARESLPGSPLYPVKIRLETWEMSRADTPEDTAQRALSHAQNRVEEVTRLADRDRPIPDDVAERFQHQLVLAIQASENLSNSLKLQVQSQISETLHTQLQMMAQIQAEGAGDDDAGGEDGVQAMIRALEEARAHLGRRDDDAPGYGAGDGELPEEEGGGYGPGESGVSVDDDDAGNSADDHDGGQDGDAGSGSGEGMVDDDPDEDGARDDPDESGGPSDDAGDDAGDDDGDPGEVPGDGQGDDPDEDGDDPDDSGNSSHDDAGDDVGDGDGDDDDDEDAGNGEGGSGNGHGGGSGEGESDEDDQGNRSGDGDDEHEEDDDDHDPGQSGGSDDDGEDDEAPGSGSDDDVDDQDDDAERD
jgi:hypothetical protein